MLELLVEGSELGEGAVRAAGPDPLDSPSIRIVPLISGLNTVLPAGSWDVLDLQPVVEIAYECFGPGRLLCGSDWPVAL